jgi:hypothetical protein
MSNKVKSVTLTLTNVKPDDSELQRIVLVQCPGAIEHMRVCNTILHCPHALPHFPTKECGDNCETIISVIM